MVAIASSNLFFACSKSKQESKENTNVSAKFESPTLSSNQQLKLDEFSTLSANFLNELNTLSKVNFCSFKKICLNHYNFLRYFFKLRRLKFDYCNADTQLKSI